jgi:hypothetical protein
MKKRTRPMVAALAANVDEAEVAARFQPNRLEA